MIITNNVPRPLLDYWDLTENEQRFVAETYNEPEDERGPYFKYRDYLYTLNEIVRTTHNPYGNATDLSDKGWDGYLADSLWTAILVRLTDDCDAVVIGRYQQMSNEE